MEQLTNITFLSQQNVETDSLVGSVGSARDCWICYDSARSEPLIRPCRCTGDVSAVHHDCLSRWLVEVRPKYTVRIPLYRINHNQSAGRVTSKSLTFATIVLRHLLRQVYDICYATNSSTTQFAAVLRQQHDHDRSYVSGTELR